MQPNHQPHQPSNPRPENREADIQRIADHFNVSPSDVLDRLAILDQQKKMTQAHLKNKDASRN